MAEMISMIIVVVDLDCHKCYNKMRKILCQLQDCERIRTISFDDKSKTITIIGPFDPQRLVCKLRCKAGKIIRDIHIVDKPPNMAGEPPPPSPVKTGKHKPKKQPPAPTAPADEPPPPAPAPPPEQPPPPEKMPPPSPAHQAPGMSAMVPPFVEKHPHGGEPAELSPPPMSPPPKEKPPPSPMHVMPMMPARPPSPPPQPVHCSPAPGTMMMPARPPCEERRRPDEYVIPTVEIPSWPAPPVGPCGCPCCAPCYQGYYEGCRCICCGSRLYAQPLPAPAGSGYRGCRTFSDEDPNAACSVM